MSLDPGIVTDRTDVHRLAAAARSILACPADIHLSVDGMDDHAEGSTRLDMLDDGGRPVFVCPTDAALAVAAAEGRGAVLTLISGLGRSGSPERDASLVLSGRLGTAGLEQCECCDELRMRVALTLDFVALGRPSRPRQSRVRVPLTAYAAPEHELNRGFLQRSVEHANLCHQDELRRAVATRYDTRLADVVGVHLVDLTPASVVLQWVDVTGSHQVDLTFGAAAGTAKELGELLRCELHAGLC